MSNVRTQSGVIRREKARERTEAQRRPTQEDGQNRELRQSIARGKPIEDVGVSSGKCGKQCSAMGVRSPQVFQYLSNCVQLVFERCDGNPEAHILGFSRCWFLLVPAWL